MKLFINILLFQVAWFACVLGAGKGNFWLGPLAVGIVLIIHVVMQTNKRAEAMIIGAATLLGLIMDTLMSKFGVFDPARRFIPAPWSPLWLICMWPNFATLFNVSLRWLHGRYFLSIVLGSTGGALAYYSGMQLGALLFNPPVIKNVIIVGIAWGIVTPVLFWIVEIANKKLSIKAEDAPAD